MSRATRLTLPEQPTRTSNKTRRRNAGVPERLGRAGPEPVCSPRVHHPSPGVRPGESPDASMFLSPCTAPSRNVFVCLVFVARQPGDRPKDGKTRVGSSVPPGAPTQGKAGKEDYAFHSSTRSIIYSLMWGQREDVSSVYDTSCGNIWREIRKRSER